MKKLLLLINLLIFIFVVASCRNKKNSTKENIIETKPVIFDYVTASDIKNTKNQTATKGVVGTGQGIKKDTNNAYVNGKAIIHHSPDDKKIDSIKNQNLKFKK